MSNAVYRSLLRLYPRAFRLEYSDDLVQVFADLCADQGPLRAWSRTGTDLLVTVPRYRLESLMNPRRANIGIAAITGAVALAGLLTLATGAYAGGLLLALALALAVAERTQLAAALRPGSADRRHQLFRTGGALAALSLATLVVGMVDLGGEATWPMGRVLAYNVIFWCAGVASLVCLFIGTRSPQTSR